MTRIALIIVFTYFLSACSAGSRSAYNGYSASSYGNVVYGTVYAPRYSAYDPIIHRYPNRQTRYYSNRYMPNKYKKKHKNKAKHQNSLTHNKVKNKNRIKHHNRAKNTKRILRIKRNRVNHKRVLRNENKRRKVKKVKQNKPGQANKHYSSRIKKRFKRSYKHKEKCQKGRGCLI